jgi:hypothetical protein
MVYNSTNYEQTEQPQKINTTTNLSDTNFKESQLKTLLVKFG